MFAHQATGDRRGFRIVLAAHHLNVELGTERIDGLRPGGMLRQLSCRATFLSCSMCYMMNIHIC